jgi:hypothetical protein
MRNNQWSQSCYTSNSLRLLSRSYSSVFISQTASLAGEPKSLIAKSLGIALSTTAV